MLNRAPGEQRRPDEFAAILASAEQPLIVAGQAVNIWASVYATSRSRLQQFAPFTSKDADIHGTRALAETLALRAGWEFKPVTERDSIIVAVLTKCGKAGEPPLHIEVLQEINGLSDADLARHATVKFETGQTYRVLTPGPLLKAKLYNLVSLVGSERPQDLRHSRMLIEIARQNLNELVAGHRKGAYPSEKLVGTIDYLTEMVQSGVSQNAARSYKLDLRKVMPASAGLAARPIAQAAARFMAGLPVMPREGPPSRGLRVDSPPLRRSPRLGL